MRRLALAALLAFAAGPVLADEFDGQKDSLSTKEKAEIKADRDEAMKAIDEKYKNDDSADGRLGRQQAIQQEEQDLAAKHGVSAGTLARQEMRTSPDEQRQIDSESQTIAADRKKKKAAGAEKPAEGQVEIVKGFSDDKPLDLSGEPTTKAEAPKLDANGEPLPTVEKGAAATDSAPAQEGASAPDDPYARFDHKNNSSHHGKKRRRTNYDE